MKNIFLISLFLIINCCNGQEKKEIKKNIITNSQKKPNMEYYNENEYKDWKFDPEYCTPQFPCPEEDKSLMNENERVRIITNAEKTVQVERTSIINPYKIVSVYSLQNKNLLNVSKDFYSFPVSYQKYDGNGKIIEEKDYNKPYKFTIEDLIEKIKKEYKVDLGDRREKAFAERRSKDGIFYYEVNLDMKEPLVTKMKYILVDGNTGKTLFTTTYYTKGKAKNPFDEYLETLKK